MFQRARGATPNEPPQNMASPTIHLRNNKSIQPQLHSHPNIGEQLPRQPIQSRGKHPYRVTP